MKVVRADVILNKPVGSLPESSNSAFKLLLGDKIASYPTGFLRRNLPFPQLTVEAGIYYQSIDARNKEQ